VCAENLSARHRQNHRDVLRGYELYNSYCFRRHGENELGRLCAPDLRCSLNQGMTEQQFLSVAMTAVKAKGTGSRAGFLSPQEVQAIYDYKIYD
jgi:cytochrome c